jgi:hypothetical protein
MRKVQHLVLLRFREGTSEQTIAECFATLADLPSKIPGIEDYAAGPNCSSEGLNKGLTHAFVMTFRNALARDQYLPHPEHERAKQLILPHVADVIVLDFEV